MVWKQLTPCSFWRCFFIAAACCLSLILSGSVILCFALEIRNPGGAKWFIRCLLDLQWLWSEWVCMVWYKDDRSSGFPFELPIFSDFTATDASSARSSLFVSVSSCAESARAIVVISGIVFWAVWQPVINKQTIPSIINRFFMLSPPESHALKWQISRPLKSEFSDISFRQHSIFSSWNL